MTRRHRLALEERAQELAEQGVDIREASAQAYEDYYAEMEHRGDLIRDEGGEA